MTSPWGGGILVILALFSNGCNGKSSLPMYLAGVECDEGCDCAVFGRLNCSGSSLSQFPEVDGNVVTANFSYNLIESYYYRVSRNNYNLRDYSGMAYLDLSHNRLRTLPPFHGMGLDSVISLNISNNRLDSWESGESSDPLFGAHSLKFLNLSSNHLPNIYRLTSWTLEILDLSRCDIMTVAYNSVSLLVNLRGLSLAHNPIKHFTGLDASSLEWLDLSWCELRTFSGKGMDNLKVLDVSGNPHVFQLNQLSAGLTKLMASSCSLDTFQGSPFPALEYLDLSNNRIESLPGLVFANNSKLTHVDLSGNAIVYLDPSEFRFAHSITWLDLSSNKLTNYGGDVFRSLTELRTLNLSRNPLSFLNHVKCGGLEVLDASHCDISKVSDTLLASLPDLRVANLSHNSIESLPTVLSSSSLSILDLGYNRISDFRPGGYFDRLRVLVLSGNRLTEPISKQATSYLPPDVQLELDNNPWRCDCESKDFSEFYDYLKKTSSYSSLECRSPENATGRTWVEACFQDPSEHYTSGLSKDKAWVPLVISVGSIVFVVVLLVGVKRMLDSSMPPRISSDEDEQSSTRSSPPRHRPSVNVIHRLNELPSYEEALLLPKLRAPPSYSPPRDIPNNAVSNAQLNTTNPTITSSLFNLATQVGPPTTKLSVSI